MEQNKLDKKILDILNKGNVLTLATAVGSAFFLPDTAAAGTGWFIFQLTHKSSPREKSVYAQMLLHSR